MLTQAEIGKEYTLNTNGCVTDLGKFEGEHWTTVSMFDLVMEGASDETLQWSEESGDCTDVFVLDDELRVFLNCNATEYAFLLEHDTQGFVTGRTVDEETYTAIILEHEKLLEPQE